jgi:hypothetical protein
MDEGKIDFPIVWCASCLRMMKNHVNTKLNYKE